MSFGDNLKRIRNQKNISQGELADKLKMHASHISRYENGATAPSIEVLKKMSSALQVSADELLYGPEDKRAKTAIKDNDLLRMFGRIQELDQNQLSCVKSLLGAYIFQEDTKKQFNM
jgi:transcriptional regulator with XRE-family HTH domain